MKPESLTKKPLKANAGYHLHKECLDSIRKHCIDSGTVELIKKRDFIKNRDRGFSIEKAIKDSSGKAVKVFDQKTNRYMISIPDFVDYHNNTIIEFKTFHLSSPPDNGGIFVTENVRPPIPDGYIDASEDFQRFIFKKCHEQYNHQFERYKTAYLIATGSPVLLHVFPVPYAKVR
jgi:hypothetical protein